MATTRRPSAAYTPLAEKILSICCCAACRRGWSVRGLDTGAVVRSLREGFASAMHETASGAGPEDVLGAQLAAQLLATRHTHADALLNEVLGLLAEVNPSLRISLHAQLDPWATGASPGLTPTSARQANAVLVPVEAASPSLRGHHRGHAARRAGGRRRRGLRRPSRAGGGR